MRASKVVSGVAALLLSVPTVSLSANLILINLDAGTGAGLDDPTPAAPVGGNPGTTIGEQRVNVYNRAAEIWGQYLDSDVDILVGATFQPLRCEATGGVLGAAGPTYVFINFPNAPRQDTIYVSAQTDALAGQDQLFVDDGIIDIDIISFFNSDIDDNDPNCLAGTSWYYGYDANEGNDIDFLSVVMHEINHGLGHLELVDETTGSKFAGFDDAYMVNMYDLSQQKYWSDMTDEERLESQVNSGNVVWSGQSVVDSSFYFLGPRPSVDVSSPASIRGSYEAQAASFGPPLQENNGPTGQMILVDDGNGVGTDACEAIQNDLTGKIALIDRGGCAFTTKVLNAQMAGAVGAIVANNAPGGPAPMGGSDPTVTIPSVGVTLALGDSFKAAAAGDSVVTLILDARFLAGASPEGYVRLNTPNPVQPGSSKSHWDPGASPNLLMEPSINDDLDPTNFMDLSPYLLQDIGWPMSNLCFE